MGKLKKAASVLSAVAMASATFLGGIKIQSLNIKTYDVGTLVEKGKAKPLGRHSIKEGKLSGFWAGNGIEMNVKCKGEGNLQLVCDTNEKVFLAVFIDGEYQERAEAITESKKDIIIKIPDGKHNIRIIRDNQIDKTGTKYFYFDTLNFDGEILKKPDDKKLYIEVIGDSIACGDGANGQYVKGQSWTDPEDHSFVKGFAYKLSVALDADYSVVARGGIGLLGDTSGSQESAGNKKVTMQEIYDYTNGFYDMGKEECLYSFERKPDLIVFELSGNDTTAMEDVWRQKVILFLSHVREVNGADVPIVWSGRSRIHCATILAIIRDNALPGGNFHSCFYEYGGSGAAALKTQTSGHPSAFEQTQISDNMIKFLDENSIIKLPPNEEKTGLPQKSDTAEAKKKDAVKKAEIIGGAALTAAALGTAAALILKKRKRK